MEVDLRDKVALVTGAGRGIGRVIGLALARHGATAVLVARTRKQVEAVAEEIRAAGGKALSIAADVGEEADVVACFRRVRDELGRLDVLVNNAGVGRFGPIAEMAAADFDAVMRVNVRGTFLCCREAMRLMQHQKSGYIINIGSVTGFRGYVNQGAYSASKHAMMGLTKALAIEGQRDGIRVSAILPGGVDTEMIGDARPDLDRSTLMQPEDVADAVMYLLSLSNRAAVDEIYVRRRTSRPF